MIELRCIVCGDILGPWKNICSEDPRETEVCSDECFEIYTMENKIDDI